MILRGLVKCSSVFFIVFLMCPKPSLFSAPVGKQQEYFHAVRRSNNEMNDPDTRTYRAFISPNIVRRREEDITIHDEEPGFDLTDDEIEKFKLWPRGIIPYYIDVLSFDDKILRDQIRMFLNEVNGLVKLNFMEMPSPPKDDETRWVFFVNRRGQLGCADHSIKNFTNTGVQRVVLGYDCMSTGGELAEAVLAIVGVPPQHNSPNRDNFIEILDANILPDKRYLFEKLKPNEWLFYDVPYDFTSAGHFDYHKHSVNGRATIKIKKPYSPIMGENTGFSNSDIKKLRMLYNYITNKQEDKVPECEKLFRRGPNFDSPPSHRQEIKPRKKPNKYLGLPEEEQDKPKAESTEAEEEKESKEVIENSDNEVTHNSLGPKNTEKPNLKTRTALYRNVKKRFDPLSYLSDYQTGDERRNGVRKNNKK